MVLAWEWQGPAIWRETGGEKSNAPTPRRRQRAREEGQSWKSPDFQSAAALIVGFLMLKWYMPWAGTHLADLEAAIYQNMVISGFAEALTALLPFILQTIAEVLAPIVLPLALVGLMVGIAQGGFSFRLGALAPDFNRINPAQGLTQMFSMNGLWNLVKGLLKITLVGVSAGLLVRQQLTQYAGVMNMTLGAALTFAKTTLTGVLLRAGLAYLFVGAVDMVWQMRSFQQSLRMTHREVRDEQKDVEGDPRLKGRRRELQRRYARSGLKAVRSATVVVTNPTHFAVALRWDDRHMAAPELVAKGADEAALRMREVAYQAEVPVVENPPVARALYPLSVGQPIPPEHYQVVAEIIAFILRRHRQRKGG
jgi:flagellar biosynthetic protein FlhB